MTGAERLVNEFIIPKKSGRAFEVRKGQILRVVAVEGPQVADLNAFNLHDLREHFSAARTRSVGGLYVREATRLYSNPGRENPMMTMVRDPIGIHDTLGTRCSAFVYRNRFGIEGYIGCQELLAGVIEPYGLSPDDTHDVLAIFMNRKIDENSKLVTLPPAVKAGDSVDLLAEMDLLVALTACPSERNPTNNYIAKPIGVQILAHG
jgi:hypothetical protein